MANEPPTGAEVEVFLTRLACINVVRHALAMLKAEPISDEEAARFGYYGSDKILMYDELKYTTKDQKRSFERWQCCNAAKQAFGSVGREWSDGDLNMLDCIHWILKRCEEEEGPEETVTLDQVMNVLIGTESAR